MTRSQYIAVNHLGRAFAMGYPTNASWVEALLPFGKTITTGGQLITDDPYTEGKEIVGGYALISADTIEEAVQLSKGCPILESAGTVEIRQVMKFD